MKTINTVAVAIALSISTLTPAAASVVPEGPVNQQGPVLHLQPKDAVVGTPDGPLPRCVLWRIIDKKMYRKYCI